MFHRFLSVVFALVFQLLMGRFHLEASQFLGVLSTVLKTLKGVKCIYHTSPRQFSKIP